MASNKLKPQKAADNDAAALGYLRKYPLQLCWLARQALDLWSLCKARTLANSAAISWKMCQNDYKIALNSTNLIVN